MDFGTGFASAVGAVGFFGWLTASVLSNARSEAQKRQLDHEARMKALELGKPLPESIETENEKRAAAANASAAAQALVEAQARPYVSRSRAAGTIGTLVPLAMAGAAAGTTAMIFNATFGPEWRIASLGIVWGVCGLVCLVTMALVFAVLSQRVTPAVRSAEEAPRQSRYPDSSSGAFTDRPSNF
jgi:hypothetical protein